MIDPRNCSPEEVLDDHLYESQTGSIDHDLPRNYAPDVVILCRKGVLHGRGGMRQLNRLLMSDSPGATFEYELKRVAGEMGFLEWAARGERGVAKGADSYLIRDGKIVAQTIHIQSSHQRKRSGRMNHERTEDLERGMDLIPKLAEIMPDQANERIRPIYEDIQRTLRVPFVNFIFRSLANYPDYLESAWGHLAPVLRTRAFETASDELRARALLEPVPDASGADWETLGDMDRIRPFSDSIHYVLPKLLLTIAPGDAIPCVPRSLPPSRGAALAQPRTRICCSAW